ALAPAGAFVDLDGTLQSERTAQLVAGGVLAQRRLDDVAVALRERGGEQRVGDADQADGAEDEHRRVPRRQSQPEHPSDGGHGFNTYPTPRTVWSSFTGKGRSILSRRRETSTSTTFVLGSKL